MAEETSSLFLQGSPSTWTDEKLVKALGWVSKNGNGRVGTRERSDAALRQSAIEKEILRRMAR